MTFLSVVTRCYKRPGMLNANQQSLARQTSQDFEQILLVDDVGLGLHAANKRLAEANPKGDYVLILDDDDLLIDDRAIEKLAEAAADRPDLVIFKADHGPLGILPSPYVFIRKEPVLNRIGSCDFITRRDVWQEHIHRFGTPQRGDYHFLASVWADGPDVVWLEDEVLARVQRISGGQPA